MQLSRFVVRYLDVRPGEHVLYDVLGDRYAGVDDLALAALERWSRGAPAGDDEAEAQRSLADMGLLVSSPAEDDERLRRHLDTAAEGFPGTLHVTLMPTLACNLACTYCFQKESPAFTNMDRATEDAAVEWILRRIDARSLSTLHIHYFGGEPLLRKDAVLRTAEAFSASMRARAGTFEWSMTTNGVLLDEKFARELRRFGDGSVKITLDGDRETHDAARVRRDGSGTFDRILANAQTAAPLVRLRVGGNFLQGQAASFERLLDRFDESGLTAKLDAVKFKPVIDTHRSAGTSCGGSCASGDETRTTLQLGRAISSRGLAPDRGEPLEGLLGPCELHWRHNFTIDPEGRVYKCPAVAGRPEMAIAAVTADRPDREAPLVAARPWEQCGSCPYLPVCVGGCLGGKYLKTGRTDEVACRKETFEAAFREAIPRRYLEEFE